MWEVIKTNTGLFVNPKICLDKLSVEVELYFAEKSCLLDNIFKLIWKIWMKTWVPKKPADKPHPQINCTLNLAAQILEKKFFERNQKKSKVKSWEIFFIHCSSNINSPLTLQRKILQSIIHNFSTLIKWTLFLPTLTYDWSSSGICWQEFIHSTQFFHRFLHYNKNMGGTFKA